MMTIGRQKTKKEKDKIGPPPSLSSFPVVFFSQFSSSSPGKKEDIIEFFQRISSSSSSSFGFGANGTYSHASTGLCTHGLVSRRLRFLSIQGKTAFFSFFFLFLSLKKK